MQVFFSSLAELESFTRRLQALPKEHACQHCPHNDQWVSHGYVYRQCPNHQSRIVGKRIVCCRRFGKLGCGRTRQLYLKSYLPRCHKRLSVVLAFITQLIRGASVQSAYDSALGHDYYEPRQAWRWLNVLQQKLGLFRLHASPRSETPLFDFAHGSRRLSVLLPTLSRLWQAGHLPSQLQQAFL